MEQNSKIPSFLRLGAQSASGSHERSASPAGVSDAATPRGGYVDLRGSWYLYGQERLGRVYPDNEPGSPDHPDNHGSTPDLTQDHVRITPEHARITHHTGPDHTGSRPEHTGSRPDPVPEHARITHHTGPDQHRITSRTHRITSGSRAGTRTDHVSNRRTGSTPDHVRRSRRNTPDHVRETWSHSGSSHPLSELFELFPPRDQLALELIARRPADGA